MNFSVYLFEMSKGVSASLQHFTPLLHMKDVNENGEYLKRMNFILFELQKGDSASLHHFSPQESRRWNEVETP